MSESAPLDPTERLLLRLTRVRPEPSLTAADLAGADLVRLVELAARLGSFNLVGRRLVATEAVALGPELRARIERHLAFADLRERLAFADLAELARDFDRRGEPLVLLKGGAYTRFIYPRRGLRRFGDLDLLLRPDALPVAVEFLVRLGYRVTSSIAGSIDLHRPLGGGNLGVALELTTDLVHQHEYPYYRRDLTVDEEDLIARSERRDLDGVPIRVLRAEDELLYSVIHFFFHHDLAGLKYQADLNALLTDPVRPIDVDRAIATARAARAGHAVGLTLLIHEAAFGPGAVPAPLLGGLAPRGARRAALERVLPPLGRLPLEPGGVATHPFKVLAAPGVAGPLALGLRWFFPGKRFLMSFYRLDPGGWRPGYHLRYPAEILRKGLRRALVVRSLHA